MKRIIRIATLLIVIALGIENVPGAQTFVSQDDSTVTVNKKAKLSKYKGIRVDPKPLDLLWQNEYNSKSKESPESKAKLIQNNQLMIEMNFPGIKNNGNFPNWNYFPNNFIGAGVFSGDYLQRTRDKKI